MTIPLTVDTLVAAYDYLRSTPPFSQWNLPEPEDITFKVIRDAGCLGWHEAKGRGKRKKQTIALSAVSNGHTSTIITTMAHEMMHLHQALTGQETPRVQHNAAFKQDLLKVCNYHGFDPKAF